MSHRHHRVLLAVAVAVHLAVLYWPSAGGQGLLPHLDKVVHLTVFAAVAFTGRLAGVPWRVLAVLLVLHAGVSEVLQGAVLPERAADPWDVVADLAGTALGLAAPTWLRRTHRRDADHAVGGTDVQRTGGGG